MQYSYPDLEAFCALCPPGEEVTEDLRESGFRLTLHLSERVYAPSTSLLVSPAQYHYSDAHGTEVIYLAGPDCAEAEGQRLPRHASRFWLYAGSKGEVYQQVLAFLAIRWRLIWQRSACAA